MIVASSRVRNLSCYWIFRTTDRITKSEVNRVPIDFQQTDSVLCITNMKILRDANALRRIQGQAILRNVTIVTKALNIHHTNIFEKIQNLEDSYLRKSLL